MALERHFQGEPAFPHRAFMLDVSRDRVPTRQTIAWLLEILAELRFNELQLYVEHTFTYTGHEVVWRDASPLTHADMAWISEVASGLGLELVANMNCFGHMGRWLAHETYRDRAECPDGMAALFGDGISEPTCLEPTEENAALAVELAREIRAAVGGNRIHIGGDEPFELGDCRSADRVSSMGRERLYLLHLDRIIGPLVADGAEVMFWADQFRRDRSLMADIPAGATGVVWNYTAPSDTIWADFVPPDLLDRLGLPADANLGFEAHARRFIESETPFWVAPGTSTWNSILGCNQNAAANIVDAARVGTASGAEGFLLTDWGDNGHWQPLVVSLPSIVRGAVAAWNGGATEPDVGVMIDELLDADPGTGALLDSLGSIGETLGLTTLNGSPVFSALVDGLPSFGDVDNAAVTSASHTIDAAIDAFAGQPFGGPHGETLAQEVTAACGLAALGLKRLADDEPSSREIDLALAAQREAWLLSSRSGGLADSLARLRR